MHYNNIHICIAPYGRNFRGAINERYIPEHQNKLNIYDLQNYEFFANFFQPEKN